MLRLQLSFQLRLFFLHSLINREPSKVTSESFLQRSNALQHHQGGSYSAQIVFKNHPSAHASCIDWISVCVDDR